MCGKYIKLMNDIDLTGLGWTPISQLENTTIDGNFHTIKGMTISNVAAVFCKINKGTIKNLIIDGATITTNTQTELIGGFVSANYGTLMNYQFFNSKITAPTGPKIGGLVYNNVGGRVIGCNVINTTITHNPDNGSIRGLICLVTKVVL